MLSEFGGFSKARNFFRGVDPERPTEAFRLYGKVFVAVWFREDVKESVPQDEGTFDFYSQVRKDEHQTTPTLILHVRRLHESRPGQSLSLLRTFRDRIVAYIK